MEQTYSQIMSEFWQKPLGNTLLLAHDPKIHQWYAVGWQCQKLLEGLIAKNHYDEDLHEQIVAYAATRGLEVTLIESTESLLAFLSGIDQQVKQRYSEGKH